MSASLVSKRPSRKGLISVARAAIAYSHGDILTRRSIGGDKCPEVHVAVQHDLCGCNMRRRVYLIGGTRMLGLGTGARKPRGRVAAFVLAALLAAPVPAAEAPLPVEEVAPGVFVAEGAVALVGPENRGHIANLGFVVGEDSVAVIDTGGSRAVGEALLAAVREKTDRPVRYVVNTHMHPDHIFGNAAFREPGVSFVGHHKLPRALASRGAHYIAANHPLLGDRLAAGLEIVPPSETVEGERRIDLGGRTLLLRAWPTAHTDNDLTVLDETTGTLFAGDLVFLTHVPALDGSLKGWIEASERLREVPAARVVPGHGPVSAWPDALDPQTRYLTALATDLRRMIAEGAPLEEAARTAGATEAAKWTLFEEFNPRNATAGYAELEWE